VKRSGFKHNTRNFLPVNLHHTFFRRHTVTVRENKPSISPALTEQISVHFHPRAAMTEWATLSFAKTKVSNSSLRPNEYANVLNHVSDRLSHLPSHWQTQKFRTTAKAIKYSVQITVAVIIPPQATTSFMTYWFCLHLRAWKLQRSGLMLWSRTKVWDGPLSER